MPTFRTLMMMTAACLLSGCIATGQSRDKASVVDYLYPNDDAPRIEPGIPRLELPLRVGVAFVPSPSPASRTLTPSDEDRLVREVGAHFASRDFVREIVPVPSAYLRPRGGFTNLDELQALFDLDVIALISFDQSRFTDEGLASLTYWTLVGAYVVRGEKNDTYTLMDAAVYDISSRSLLFRAPGSSRVASSATPINLSEQLRQDSLQGFELASRELVTGLDSELDRFRERVRDAPERYQVVQTAGPGGASSVDAVTLLVLLLSTTALLSMRRLRREV